MLHIIKYTLKRLVISLPVILLMTVFVFFLSNLIPGSPVDALVTTDTTPQERDRLMISMGLDKPLYVQYVRWLGRFLHGNLGLSFRMGTPVTHVLADRVGPTLILTGASLLLMIVLGLTLGILAAVKPYSAWDYTASAVSFTGSGIPGFFLALIAVYIFCVKLRWLPTGGMYSSGSHRTIGGLLYHLILPASVLAISMMGSLIRQTRSAMLEVLEEDYIRMARAKGMRTGNIIFKQALHNAMIPIITQIGLQITWVVGGAVVTEQIFGWPGMGALLVGSITARDYPTIMGITVYIIVIVLAINILIDILYGVLDPRVRI